MTRAVLFSCVVFILLGFLAMSEACSDEDWTSFKTEFKKTYATVEEETMRREVFCDHQKLVAEHNERHERGEVGYTLGINHFSDRTKEEVNKGLLGGLKHKHHDITEELQD